MSGFADLKSDNDSLSASTAELRDTCDTVKMLVTLGMTAMQAGKKVTEGLLIANGVPPAVASAGARLFDVALEKARGKVAGA